MAEEKVLHWEVDDDNNPHPHGIHFHGYGTEEVLLENLKQHYGNPAIVKQDDGSFLLFRDSSEKRAKKNAIGKAALKE